MRFSREEIETAHVYKFTPEITQVSWNVYDPKHVHYSVLIGVRIFIKIEKYMYTCFTYQNLFG